MGLKQYQPATPASEPANGKSPLPHERLPHAMWRWLAEARRGGSSLRDVLAFALPSIRRVAAARRRAAITLSDITPPRVTVNLAEHSAYLARYLTLSEANEIADLFEQKDLLGGLSRLKGIADKVLPPSSALPRIISRAQASVRMLEEDWRPDQQGPAVRHERRALFAFHSRGLLVNNGYAARSLEMLGAVRRVGWETQAVTRLGYPTDIDRYRDVETLEIEDYGGARCRRLDDMGDGLRGRPLDDYLEAYTARLELEIAQYRPSVIHAASNYLNGLAAINAARRTGIASIYEVRGLWEVTALSRGNYDETDVRYRLAERLETAAASHADQVIAISDGVKARLVERGAPAEKIDVIPNCVDVERLSNEPVDQALKSSMRLGGVIVLGYFGAFAAYEGLDLFLDALARLCAKGLPVKGLVVGGGGEEQALKQQAAALAISEDVIFTGKVSREMASRYAMLADVVVLPRQDTPVTRIVPPIKAVEAMARRQPLVVSDLPALTDVVKEGVNGLTFPAGDVTAFCDRLEALVSNETLRSSLGKGGFATARASFDVAVASSKLEAVYSKALAGR